MAAIKLKWTVDDIDNVIALYDVVKVYRSTTGQGGVYNEITGPGTRVTLVADQTLYEYVDTAGDPTYWYQTAFYNTVTTDESTPSDPIMGDSPGLYCTLSEIRDEGFSETEFPDVRVLATMARASRMIERATGRWFEPRDLDLHLDGKGSQALRLGHAIISITSVAIDDTDLELTDLRIYNRRVTENLLSPDDREDPRIELYNSYESDLISGYPSTWPRGQQNIHVVGSFGYTEYDGSSTGQTPELINRLCVLLVARDLEPVSDEWSRSGRREHYRIVQTKTRDQSITLARPIVSPLSTLARGMLTGDPEIDGLIMTFRRPSAIGSI